MEQFQWKQLYPQAFSDIDKKTDSFIKIRDICSDRLYGESSRVPSPWLSVLIPTFQRDILLQEALQSVLSQEPVDFSWELIVVDNTPLGEDGSTPALNIVRAIGDIRILYYHNRVNLGSGYNWNRAAELARGKWLCFLHDDDLLCPNALNDLGRQIRAYCGKKPLGYLHARAANFSGAFCPKQNRRHYPPERLTRFGMLLSGPTGAGAPTCGTVILKAAYMETGGICYDYACGADAVLCCQIMKNYAVICSDRLLGGYRWKDNESLKKDSLLGMIQADELLSKFLYRQSSFAHIWEKLFGPAIAWRNIRKKMEIAEKYHVEITKEEFCGVSLYVEPGICKKCLFEIIYVIYRLIRRWDGFWQQIKY